MTENKLKNGCCPVCGSSLVNACPGFWKCVNCGATSTGIKLADPLNSLILCHIKPKTKR